ncbi:MAG TPA: N-acetylneuraminate synthase family protein [Syntrophomonadaceae bacterium]|nr:N-acetylneuraminate synthase family protein [Syntrophomonadaceae bacterium]
MKIDNYDLDKDVLIVAEIGNNHEGSYTLAEDMVGLAADAGVGAVKFQTYQTEFYVSKTDEARFSRLKAFELNFDEFERLSKVARHAGLIFLSTPFDIESAQFLNNIVPAFKIASGDNNFYPLINCVAHTLKPVILSSGLADMTQIRYTKALIEQVWSEHNTEQKLAILHCVTSYPVPTDQANLAAIRNLQSNLNCTIGYSDHTIGITAAVLSVALGARIIEKHFTIDKNYSDFRDHQISADPAEMKSLVDAVKQATVLLGSGEKVLQSSEKEVVTAVRRSIVSRRDLPAGKILSGNDITWVRPAGGIAPGNESLLLGKEIKKAVSKGQMLTADIFDEKA